MFYTLSLANLASAGLFSVAILAHGQTLNAPLAYITLLACFLSYMAEAHLHFEEYLSWYIGFVHTLTPSELSLMATTIPMTHNEAEIAMMEVDTMLNETR